MTEIKRVVIFDPATGSSNIGDQVIIEGVENQLRKIFSAAFVIRISMHQPLTDKHRKYAREADLTFVAGSNMLKGNWPVLERWKRWQTSVIDTFSLRDVILWGPGWSHSRFHPTLFGKILYNRVLSKKYIHAVRDEMTVERLAHCGVDNSINTSCPSLWDIDADHCRSIPQSRGRNVIVTVSDYNRSPVKDLAMFSQLRKLYERVYLWPQGFGDIQYIGALGVDWVEVMAPGLKAYDQLLSSDISIDYVGTRLHGGVRALQHKRRVLIVSVDQRAEEIGRHTGLPVLKRENVGALSDRLENVSKIQVEPPREAINRWCQQFA